MNALSDNPTRTRTRALMPDYLRLVALFGIVVVNVQFIAFSVFDGGLSGVPQTRVDAVAGDRGLGVVLSGPCGSRGRND